MPHTSLQKVTTGVPGLDEALGGGLIKTGVYLVEGEPGAGKTILAHQIAFAFAERGEPTLVVTLMVESHGKLLNHLRAFEFFDDAAVRSRIKLVSGYNELLESGLGALLHLLATELRDHRPSLLIIDGFGSAIEFAESTRELAKFMLDLNALVTLSSCTTLILSPLRAGQAARPEYTLVDGLIELQRFSRGLRRARLLEVRKLRGSAHMTGQHYFRIRNAGIRVYPRLESVVRSAAVPGLPSDAAVDTGVTGFEQLAPDGLGAGSSTCLLGAPGVGKTLFGMTFLHAGAARGEPALYLGFNETPEHLAQKARKVGLDLQPHVDRGTLRMHWYPPVQVVLDVVAHELLALVDAHGVRRLFLDGVEGLFKASLTPERFEPFMAALTNALRMRGVTACYASELPMFDEAIRVRGEVSPLFENIVLMRYYEREGALRRLVAVVKMRDRGFDPRLFEFGIDASGVRVGAPLHGLVDVLSGRPRARGDAQHSDSEGGSSR